MAYNQFTLQRVAADFGLVLDSPHDLFPGVISCPISNALRAQLRFRTGWATMVNTEAARTQFLVAPLLGEVLERSDLKVAVYAGTRFDVDDAAGLTGVCDYILGRPPQLDYVTAPVMMIVEAKNEDIWGGVGQCAAELVAAQKFNAARGAADEVLHGASTDGTDWRFIRLDGNRLSIDFRIRSVAEPDVILGILFHICGVTPAAPVAA